MSDSAKRSQRTTGHAMIYAAWAGLLVLAWAFFSGVLDKLDNPNRHLLKDDGQAVSEIVLSRNRQGHYVAPGTVNGVITSFLVDTGATDVAVSQDIAQRAGLPRLRRVTSYTANGTVDAWATRIDRLSVGGLVVQNVKASILPTMASGEALLGMSVLKHLELVQRGDRLTLRIP